MRLEKFSNLWSDKEYIVGIDDKGQTLTKKLNGFQNILRSLFGFYEETHLRNITKLIAHKMCLVNLGKCEFTLAKDAAMKVEQLFYKRFFRAEEIESISDEIILYDGVNIFNSHYRWVCNLQSASRCTLKIEKEFSTSVILRAKNSNSLEVIDQITSDALSKKADSDPIFSELLNFLLNVLYHSPKIEKIYYKNAPEKCLPFNENIVYEKDAEGNVWTIINRPKQLVKRMPPLSLDFLLLFSRETLSLN